MSATSMRRFAAVLEAARLTSGFITAEELLRTGISSSTISRWVEMGLLHRVQRGVFRIQAGAFGFDESLDLAMKIACDQQVIGGRTALEVWGLPGGVRTKVNLVGPRGIRSRSLHVVSWESRDLRPVDSILRGRLRLTTPLRSIIDSAPFCTEEQVGQQLTAAVGARYFTYDDVQTRLAELSRRGRRGPSKVRKVLRVRITLDERATNSYEKVAQRVFGRGGFPPPLPQYRIEVGGRTYYVDFAWPQFKLFVECDSMLAHSSPEQLQADLARQNDLVAAGWIPIRFTYWDVLERPDDVIAQLSLHLPRLKAA